MQAMRTHSTQVANENFTMMEKHVAEVLKSQSLFVDEHNEIHEKRVKMEMEKFEKAMELESTYRDTVQTTHELATDEKLANMECRASTEREKLGQEIMEKQEQTEQTIVTVKEKIDNLEQTTKEATEKVAGDLANVERNMTDNVIQILWDLVEKKCGMHLQLVDEGTVRLLDAPQTTLDMEDADVPIWGNGEDEEEEDEVEFVDKADDDECITNDEITTKQEDIANQASNVSFGSTLDCFSDDLEKQDGMDAGGFESKGSGNRFKKPCSARLSSCTQPLPSLQPSMM